MDAFFELPEIMDDINHPQYENLQKDIANINIEDLNTYVGENKIDRFLERFEDKHLARCRFYLVDKIRHQLSADRLEILAETNLSAPYTSTNLEDLTILENNLVHSSDFIRLVMLLNMATMFTIYLHLLMHPIQVIGFLKQLEN
jgi:hypothetical protein